MKTKFFLSLILSFTFYLLSSQVPQGFNYQAIARDASGNPIVGATIKVKLSILSDTTGFFASGTGTYLWEEEQTDIRTNAFGLFTVVFGNPSATKVQGTASSFSSIPWSVTPLYLGTKIANPTTYKNLGSAQVFSVPYAMIAQNVTGQKKLTVAYNTTNMEEALFEVKNNLNQTVFAVYNEGVRVSVGDGNAKGTKGGFAIGGFDIAKAPGQEYLRVTPDSTRVYIKEPIGKGATKGGFAIGGFDGVKGTTPINFMNVTKNNYFIGHETGIKVVTSTTTPLTGLYNSVIGFQAARELTTGNYNTILGYKADSSITTGNNNIIIGATAGFKLTTGNHNTLIGSGAGFNHTSQQYNVMIGTTAGYNVTGSFNTFLGINAGYKIISGINNTFLGTNAGAMLENGNGNTIIGIDAGRSGSWDPGVYHTGFTTSDNTIIGNRAGYNLDVGSGNVYIGYGAGAAEVGTVGSPSSNKLYISNSWGTALIYGDFASGSIGIGTMTLTKTLNVGGDAAVSGNITSGSITVDQTATINSVLKLTPIAAPPESPTEGMIYYDSTDHKLHIYNGTIWLHIYAM